MGDLLGDIQAARRILDASQVHRAAWADKLATRLASVLPPSLQIVAYSGVAMTSQYGNGFRVALTCTTSPHDHTVTLAFLLDPMVAPNGLCLTVKRMAKKVLYAPRRSHGQSIRRRL